jgi:hypothetical protein
MGSDKLAASCLSDRNGPFWLLWKVEGNQGIENVTTYRQNHSWFRVRLPFFSTPCVHSSLRDSLMTRLGGIAEFPTPRVPTPRSPVTARASHCTLSTREHTPRRAHRIAPRSRRVAAHGGSHNAHYANRTRDTGRADHRTRYMQLARPAPACSRAPLDITQRRYVSAPVPSAQRVPTRTLRGHGACTSLHSPYSRARPAPALLPSPPRTPSPCSLGPLDSDPLRVFRDLSREQRTLGLALLGPSDLRNG